MKIAVALTVTQPAICDIVSRSKIEDISTQRELDVVAQETARSRSLGVR